MSLKITLLKNTVFNLAGYVYLLLVSFFSISIYLRNLGKDLFGIYIFLSAFVAIASVFDFGISQAAIRELSLPNLEADKKKKIWQTAISIFLVQATFLFFLFWALISYLFYSMPLLAGLSGQKTFLITVIISATIFMNHINNIFLSLPQANQRFDIFNSKTFIVGTANTIVSALATHYTADLSILFTIQLFSHIVSMLIVGIYVHRQFGAGGFMPKIDPKIQKTLRSYGIKNFIGTLSGQIEYQMSKFFLGFLSTATAISSFTIPQNIVLKGAGLVSQLSQAFFPLTASLLEKDRVLKLRRLYNTLQVMVFVLGAVSVYAAFYFGESFLMWWLNDITMVAVAFPTLKVLSFYFLLLSLTPIPTALIQGLGKPQVPSFFAVITVIIEASLMSVLIPKYQTLGAAYSFLGSLIITVPSFLITTKVIFNRYIKKILLPA